MKQFSDNSLVLKASFPAEGAYREVLCKGVCVRKKWGDCVQFFSTCLYITDSERIGEMKLVFSPPET